jgi:hypothetical protein
LKEEYKVEEHQEKEKMHQQQMDLNFEAQRLMEEKGLLKQVVTCLNRRLAVQLELLTHQPRNITANDQRQWKAVQDSCNDLDWQLGHMKARLLDMENVPKQSLRTSPFSDAIAAGQATLTVAQQLHDDVPDTDSYASALTKEMHMMRDTYEQKLRDLQDELKRAQALRSECANRFHKEQQEEKSRYTTMVW